MHERIAGPDSFWYPYLKILPYPGSIADWNAAELAELQNEYVSCVTACCDHSRVQTCANNVAGT